MRYSSYYLYRKYEQRDGQDVLPVIPTTYSIDGEGTMPKVLHLADDPSCGEIPWQYRWVDMDINTDYWCNECSPDYSKMYFTTVAMQDNVTITFNNGLDYSLDEGESWLHKDLNPGATINASALSSIACFLSRIVSVRIILVQLSNRIPSTLKKISEAGFGRDVPEFCGERFDCR